jgi:hypothetical protein
MVVVAEGLMTQMPVMVVPEPIGMLLMVWVVEAAVAVVLVLSLPQVVTEGFMEAVEVVQVVVDRGQIMRAQTAS